MTTFEEQEKKDDELRKIYARDFGGLELDDQVEKVVDEIWPKLIETSSGSDEQNPLKQLIGGLQLCQKETEEFRPTEEQMNTRMTI